MHILPNKDTYQLIQLVILTHLLPREVRKDLEYNTYSGQFRTARKVLGYNTYSGQFRTARKVLEYNTYSGQFRTARKVLEYKFRPLSIHQEHSVTTNDYQEPTNSFTN